MDYPHAVIGAAAAVHAQVVDEELSRRHPQQLRIGADAVPPPHAVGMVNDQEDVVALVQGGSGGPALPGQNADHQTSDERQHDE